MGSQVAADKGQRVSGQLMGAAQVTGIPYALVVDRGGVIRYNGHPADPQMDAVVKQVCYFDWAGPKERILLKFCWHNELVSEQYHLLLTNMAPDHVGILALPNLQVLYTFRLGMMSNPQEA